MTLSRMINSINKMKNVDNGIKTPKDFNKLSPEDKIKVMDVLIAKKASLKVAA